MVLGFDVDGPLAIFDEAYQALTVEVTGRNLFPGPVPVDGPPTWDWPQHYGYSDEEMKRVWAVIRGSDTFWDMLAPAPGMQALARVWHRLNDVDTYFVTARVGTRAKAQTERFLYFYLPGHRPHPTVLLSPHKAEVVKALGITHYIDDNLENVGNTAIHNRKTKVYLLDRAYNREGADHLGTGGFSNARRVLSVDEMLADVLK